MAHAMVHDSARDHGWLLMLERIIADGIFLFQFLEFVD
jgi:hypothetical protein